MSLIIKIIEVYTSNLKAAENKCYKFRSNSVYLTDDTSLAATEQSDNSSALEETESGDTGSDSLNLAELEQLSHELANKGPAEADLQLR